MRLTQPPLPLGRRAAALAIDLAWLLACAAPLAWAWRAPDAPWRVLDAALLLAAAMLLAALAWLAWAATPGQWLLRQLVVDADGEPRLKRRQALLRALIAPLGWLLLPFKRRSGTPGARGAARAADAEASQGASAARAARTTHATGTTHATHATHAGHAADDAGPLGWHDIGSGSAVVDAVEHDGERASAWAQLARGELPWSQSLWLALALPLPLLLALGALEAYGRGYGTGLGLIGPVVLLGWLALLALLLVLGRALVRVARVQPLGLAPRLAIAAGVLAITGAAALRLVGDVLPHAWHWLLPITGRDAIGQVSLQRSADGRRLALRGPLGMGDAGRVAASIDASPALQWLLLDSTQGRLAEAERLAAFVRARGLSTRVVGACDGVCPVVFLAGRERQVMPGGTLGFRRLSVGPFNTLFQPRANQLLARALRSGGLSAHAVTKALATPPTALWVADVEELQRAQLVHVPARPWDPDLPEATTASAADYVDALSASPLWQALERRLPGVQKLAAARMAAAAPAGTEAVQRAAHSVVGASMPQLLREASPELRARYAELLTEQVASLSVADTALCRELLLGDAAAHRRLPAAMLWREAQWLHDTLRQPPAPAPAGTPALGEEVMRRALGKGAPALLAQLWRPPDAQTNPPREPVCARAHALLDAVTGLPWPERQIAHRMLFVR